MYKNKFDIIEDEYEKAKINVSGFIDNNKKSIKIGAYAIAGIASIFVLGIVFRIFATSLRGYNDFTNALKGK